jgi:hypothetical protein
VVEHRLLAISSTSHELSSVSELKCSEETAKISSAVILAEFKRRPQDYLKPAADCCGKSPCCCGKPSGGESLEEVKRDV